MLIKAPLIYLLIILGMLWRKYYPKDINDSSGYRTEQSMKSREVWMYSQKFFAWLSLIEGHVILLLSVVLMIALVIHGYHGYNTFINADSALFIHTYLYHYGSKTEKKISQLIIIADFLNLLFR